VLDPIVSLGVVFCSGWINKNLLALLLLLVFPFKNGGNGVFFQTRGLLLAEGHQRNAFLSFSNWLLFLTMAPIDVDYRQHGMDKEGPFKTFSIAFTVTQSKTQAMKVVSVFKACCWLLLQMWLPR
jgi:hypothetical protein